MYKFDLSIGEVSVKDYESNIEIFINDFWIDESFDGYVEFTTKENLDALINKITDKVDLIPEDIEKLREELHSYVYAHSIEIHTNFVINSYDWKHVEDLTHKYITIHECELSIDDLWNDATADEIRSIIDECGDIDLEEYYTDIISKM